MYNSSMNESFTLSHFLRRSGEVLRVADDRDVTLERRDGDDLLMTTVRRADIQRTALEVLAETVLEVIRDEAICSAFARALTSSVRWTSALSEAERERLVRDVAKAAAESTGLGTAAPLTQTLETWQRAARTKAARRPVSAHLTRPVAIPDDVDDPSIDKASGIVELPLRVRWSYPRRTYDLDDERQRRIVYEQVLSEGLDEDVRRYIDVDTLIADWDELVLPQRVRRAWAQWLRRERDLDLAC